MYHELGSRYDILFAIDQLVGALSKHSIAHMGVAKNLLRSLARSVNVSIAYKRGGFKLTAHPEANSDDKNPVNGKSKTSYIVELANDPVNLKYIAWYSRAIGRGG